MGILTWDLSLQSQAEFMFSCTGTGAYKYFGSFPLGPIAPGHGCSRYRLPAAARNLAFLLPRLFMASLRDTREHRALLISVIAR